MKKKVIFTFKIIFLLVTISAEARGAVLVVDNSSNSPGIYDNINAAVSAALPGDTIYLQPTGLQYQSATITKPLVVIGPGHNLPWTTSFAVVPSITIQATASGTLLEGFIIINSISLANNTTDVTIRNCRFSGTNFRLTTGINCHNLMVEGNVFQNYTSLFSCIALTQSSQNVLIKNNYFFLNSTGSTVSIITGTNTTTTFDHNTVIIANTGGAYCSSCQAHTISNNIWIGASQLVANQNISSGATGSIFYNNQTWSPITTYDPLPGDNNLDNIEPVFVNASSYAWSIDNDYNLEESNAGFAGSSAGSQIGMYGGSFDFRKRGEPRGVPTFDQVLLLTTSVPEDGTIQIRVKAKKGME